MSIDNSSSKIQYTLSSATQTLPVPFYFLAEGDLKVIKAGTTETVLILDTDYTVTGEGDTDGGSVILTGTDTDIGDDITITRDVAITQPVDYEENDKFPAEVHERALDRLTMIAQQLQESVSRSIKVPETEPADTVLVLPTKTARENTVLAFDEDGEIVAIPDSDSALAQSAANAAAAQQSAGEAAASAEAAAEEVALLTPLPTDRLLGRVSSGTGDVEQIQITDKFQELFDDATASDMRSTLGLGSMATQAASSVAITGGSTTGLSALSMGSGGVVNLGANNLSIVTSDLLASHGITQASAGSGDNVIFNTPGAPSVSLTAGTWLLFGSLSVRTSDVDDVILVQFYDDGAATAFGGGGGYTEVSGSLARVPVPTYGVLTVPSGTKTVRFIVSNAGSSLLDVGGSYAPAGYIVAVRLPI